MGLGTGAAQGFLADVAATAKKGLEAGQVLDGEGGYTAYGKLMPAGDSLRMGALPIGVADGARLKTHIATGQVITWADVEMDEDAPALRFRREMEAAFGGGVRDGKERRP